MFTVTIRNTHNPQAKCKSSSNLRQEVDMALKVVTVEEDYCLLRCDAMEPGAKQ
jgi:hypothetical protein